LSHGWPVIGESYMSGTIERFFEYMTIEYINHVWELSIQNEEALVCDESTLINIITAVKNRLTPEQRDELGYNFRFHTIYGDFDVNFNNIFIAQESYTIEEIWRYLSAW
jgi:hypothetical protein